MEVEEVGMVFSVVRGKSFSIAGSVNDTELATL